MFVPVLIYNTDAEFLGYSIMRPRQSEKAPYKLQSTNVWKEDEISDLRQQVERLNERTGMLANWPSIDDPDVMKLIGNPTWEPVPDEPIQVVDEESSTIIENELGEVDHGKSNIVTKTIMGPSPVLAAARIKKAQEIVARRRMDE
jgi:NifB/MoaA-like Fe-S oxidoreductase